MTDYSKAGLATDLNAGNLLTDEDISRVASRQSTNTKRSRPNREDIERQVTVEKPDHGDSSSLSSQDLEPTYTSDKIILSFTDDDPENPYSWGMFKKMFVLFVSILCVMNSTVSSGLASNSSAFYSADFGVTSNALLILPTSLFLLGYVIGPVFFGPMSEQYGRKPIMIFAFVFYAIFSMASALAPNLAALTIFRFLCGIGAACPIVVVGGTCADVYKSPVSRGRAMAIFMGATTFGPCAGPVISGYISPVLNWRWSFWVGLIFAGVTLVPLFLVPETYAPVLLKRRAMKMRKESGNDMIMAPIELEKEDWRHVVSKVLTRPIRMFIFEPLVLFSCLYLSFVYGVFYMLFQAYPVVYVDIYGFSLGQEGLTFLSIGVGACFAIPIYLWWDSITKKARAENAQWVQQEEYRRLPLACAGGPFFVISCFWLGWSARESVHWAVPVCSGIFFGIGYLLIFMALLNYLVDAYKIFAASAMAAASASRSFFGCVLPFAARPRLSRAKSGVADDAQALGGYFGIPGLRKPVSSTIRDDNELYDNLGVPWACSLLGFLSLLMAAIPFVFIWKGETIRGRSEFCQYLLQKEIEEQEKKERRARREQKRLGLQEKQQQQQEDAQAAGSGTAGSGSPNKSDDVV